MNSIEFSHEEYDLLTELINVSMGKSAAELAKLFNHFVKLKVPALNIESSEVLPETIIKSSLFGELEKVIVIQQKFHNDYSLKGEGAIILNYKTRQTILPLLELTEDDIGSEEINDFLLELSGQLISSCLSNLLMEFFKSPTTFESPAITSKEENLRQVAYKSFEFGYQQYGDILYSKIDFIIDVVNFQCDLFFFIDTESLSHLQKILQKILEESS
ncbi:MAG: hypothetical protein JEY91_01445 [Spirochaetaceae bacterium]|nr:hypothetical protein [Spirochaetaceae bacterium]